MASPDISLLGATYSGVTGVTLPKSGGGTATFPWVEGSETKTQNGTYDVTNLAELVVNVSGGGGASNVVYGSFTAASTSGAQSISIPYTGSGYPNFISIYPNDGFRSGNSLYNTLHRYAIIEVAICRADPNGPPSYTGSGTNNQGYVVMLYKSSASSGGATSSTRINGAATFSSSAASSGVDTAVRMSSNKAMSIYVSDTSYGFLAGETYRYVIVYSS